LSTKDLIRKAKKAQRKEGTLYILKKGVELFSKIVKNSVILEYYKIFKSNDTFEFNGSRYNYFYSLYGATWRTERAVEIPIVWKFIDKSSRANEKILEVGNVLSYRFNVSHDILDKYEETNGIINEDVVDFDRGYKYDLIVSISTLEHVGFDEEVKDPLKIVKSIENLKRLLSNNGKLVVTLPLGQNIEMDGLIAKKILIFDKMFYMKRENGNNWIQLKEINPYDVVYNDKIPTANAIVVGISNGPQS